MLPPGRIDAVVAQHADEARRVGIEAPFFRAQHGVDRADAGCRRIDLRQQGHYILLVGDGDVEAVQGAEQFLCPRDEVLPGDFDDAVVRIDAHLPEDGLVDGAGQAVPQLFPDQTVMLHRFAFFLYTALYHAGRPLVHG